jgi:hypothetical protein
MERRVEGGWEIGGFAFAENPRFTTPRWARVLAHTWAHLRAARGGGIGGIGPMVLVRAGGFGDQPALAIEAFQLFDRWLEEMRGNEVKD